MDIQGIIIIINTVVIIGLIVNIGILWQDKDYLERSAYYADLRLCKIEQSEGMSANYKLSNETNTNDPINPAHYKGRIEVIDFIEDKQLNYHLGNAVKYIARAGKKDADKYIQDLQKECPLAQNARYSGNRSKKIGTSYFYFKAIQTLRLIH